MIVIVRLDCNSFLVRPLLLCIILRRKQSCVEVYPAFKLKICAEKSDTCTKPHGQFVNLLNCYEHVLALADKCWITKQSAY